jgi:hypothetical protein
MTYAERACLRIATLVAFPPSLRCDCRRDAVAGDLHHQRAAANAVLEKVADGRPVQDADVLSDALVLEAKADLPFFA